MIEVDRHALFDVLFPLTQDEGAAYGEGLTPYHVSSVTEAFERTGDEPFVRIALEQLLKAGTEEEYGHVAPLFGSNTEEPLRELYEALYGPVPDGPAPKVAYRRLTETSDPVPRQRAEWTTLRERLYGPPPYDYEVLRERALQS